MDGVLGRFSAINTFVAIPQGYFLGEFPMHVSGGIVSSFSITHNLRKLFGQSYQFFKSPGRRG
jgi:hypothetical protein